MLTKLAGGTIYDPAHGERRRARHLCAGGRIVASPIRMSASTQIRRGRLRRDGGRHRPAHPHRRRQGEPGAHAAARRPREATESRAPTSRAPAAGTPRPRRWPPAIATPRWATPPASSRPWCPPTRARRTWRWATRPIVDNGAYVMLGNDELLLRLLAARGRVRARSATTSPGRSTPRRRSGVKVVNPGGISAFKFNQRKLDLDEEHVHWRVTPRQVVLTAGPRAPRARRPASAARARLQPRRARQHRLHARHHPRARKACRCTSRTCSSTATAPKGDASSRRARRASPSRQRARRTSPSTSARSCSARRARHRATRCANTQRRPRPSAQVDGDGHRVRGGLRRRAVPLSRQELRQRVAVGDRARDISAGR